MFPLVFNDFKKNYFNLGNDHKKGIKRDEPGFQLCQVCYNMVTLLEKRSQALTFLSDKTKERILKLQIVPVEQWTEQDYLLVFNLYKGNKKALVSGTQQNGGDANIFKTRKTRNLKLD